MILIVALVAVCAQADPLFNWSRNIEFTTENVVTPSTEAELVEVVRNAGGPLKAAGTRHCFNDIADTPGIQISPANFQSISVDPASQTVTFGAGVIYSQLIEALVLAKMALPNLPSLPHINVVGSVVTGTHGGGIRNQAHASYVKAFKMVNPAGEVQLWTEDMPEFKSHLHSFGALGFIYEMTMRVEPEYAVVKCIYEDLSWDFMQDRDAYWDLLESHQFTSFFTDWKQPTMTSIWLGKKVPMTEVPENWEKLTMNDVCEPTFHGAKLVERIHPVPGRDSSPCVTSGIGLWRNKIYHFLPDKPPSSAGDEIQTELFVDIEDFPFVAEKIYRLAPLFTDFIQITELRPVAQDDIPMSPTKGRDSMGIHWTWKHDFDNLLLPIWQIQQIMKAYDYRPHYGKFFHPVFESDFTKANGFEKDHADLVARINAYPENPFVNCFIQRYLYNQHDCSLESKFQAYYAAHWERKTSLKESPYPLTLPGVRDRNEWSVFGKSLSPMQ